MSTVQRKREARIRRIHDAAAKHFAAHGFHATRMEDIAAELDLQKGALYYYFASKAELLTKLIEERIGVAVEALEVIAASDAPPVDKIRRAVASHLHVFQEHADVYRIFNTERLSSIDPAAAQAVDTVGRKYETLWRELLAAGVEAGMLRGDLDVTIEVKAIVGMCNSTLFWLRPDGRLTIDQVADAFADILVDGLTAR